MKPLTIANLTGCGLISVLEDRLARGGSAVHNLRQRLLPDPDFRVKVIEPYQMLGEIDMEMIEILELDVAGVHGPWTMYSFRLEGWKPFMMHDGTEVIQGNHWSNTKCIS